MKVNIRCSNGDTFAVNDVDQNQTVGDFKQVVAEQSQIPASDQRLIYRGKVLKDQATLKSYGVEDGLTVHLVRGTPKPATPSTTSSTTPTTTATTSTPTTSIPTTTTTTPTPTSTTNIPTTSTPTSAPSNNNTNQQQNPFNMFGGMGGMGNLLGNMGGSGGMPNMDPQQMQQMMNNPMVQSLLNNPDFIREIMSTNPQIQEIMRNNPEVGRMLQDPDMIRRAMEMSRNPELMREMMRNTDLALSNIENLPGGFDALRRMYSDVQEPLHEATSEMLRQPNQTNTTSNQPTTNVPTGQPFNMWGNNQPPTGTTNTQNTTSNTNTTTGTNQNANPFSMFGNMGSGGMGGMGNLFGNMGGNGMPNINPQQAQQMMNNPLMQQMMQQMLSDPNTLDQLIGSNPMLQQMTQQNPMLRTMLGNPQFIQQVMQLQGLLNQNQPPNTNNTSTTGTTGTPNPFENLQQMMQGMNLGGNTGAQNPFAMFGNNNPFMPQSQTTQQPPRERFATQLGQLQEMGFFDEQSNIEALLVANGNVNAAIEYLLSNPPPSRN